MTHDGELRLRVCRNYQPKMERAVRAAWGELVPTTVARNVRETWSRLLYRRKPTKAPAEDAQDASIGGIWKNLFTVGSGRDVRGDARRCWAEVLKVDASAAVQAAEEEPKQAPEREVVCVLAEAEVDEDVADDEDVVAEVVVDEVVKAEEEDVESDEDVQENAIEEEARSQKTWEELEVTLDCTAGVNMTGLQFAQRDDGLLRVSVCKPGGTASKKVRLNDVLLATTYVVMVPDPTGERRAGVPELEWMDAVREGHSFNTLQEAMLTHSQEMKLRLARGDVPLGALAATSASVSAPPEESPAAEAERRYREAESAREMAKKSMRAPPPPLARRSPRTSRRGRRRSPPRRARRAARDFFFSRLGDINTRQERRRVESLAFERLVMAYIVRLPPVTSRVFKKQARLTARPRSRGTRGAARGDRNGVLASPPSAFSNCASIFFAKELRAGDAHPDRCGGGGRSRAPPGVAPSTRTARPRR